MTRNQRHDVISLAVKEGVRAHDERVSPLLNKDSELPVDFVLLARAQENDLLPEGACCRQQVSRYGLGVGISRIDEHGESACGGQQVMQQTEPLGPDQCAEEGN